MTFRAMALALALGAAPAAALAQQPAAMTPEQHLRSGIELRRVGHDEEALRAFTAAWEGDHSARARAQMALAQQALGRWVEAETWLEEALAMTSDPWIVRNRTALLESLAAIRPRVGRLEIGGGVPGAEVLVDGTSRATLPLREALRVPVGAVTLTVRAEGYVPLVRTVTVVAGTLSREQVTLAPAPTPIAAPAPDRTVANNPPTTAPTAPVVPPVVPPEGPRRPGGSGLRIAGWTFAGAAVLAAVGASVALVTRNNRAVAFNSDESGCSYQHESDLSTACSERRDGVNLMGALSIGGFVLAGGFAVASVTLLALSPGSRSERRAGLRCGGGPGTVGAACQWSW